MNSFQQHSFRIDEKPVPKGRPQWARGRMVTPSRTRDAESLYARALREQVRSGGYVGPHGDEPLTVDVLFMMPSTKAHKEKEDSPHLKTPDVDNLAKLALDAANGILWEDDRQIWRLCIEKRYAGPGGSPYVALDVSWGVPP